MMSFKFLFLDDYIRLTMTVTNSYHCIVTANSCHELTTITKINLLCYQITFLPLKSENLKILNLSGKISDKQTTPKMVLEYYDC